MIIEVLFWATFAALVTGAAALAVLATLHQPGRTTQIGVVMLTISMIGGIWYSLGDQLGRPKPVNIEWWLRNSNEASVLASQMQEGQSLYLWLKIDGQSTPLAYVMPWDKDMAQQLQAALEEAQRNGTQARMRMPFEPTLDAREPKFYAPPQPALPPKDFAQPPAQVYVQPGEDA